MAGIQDYSVTAAENGTVGGVDIAEGCLAGNLNNGMRAIMADLASFLVAPALSGNTTISGDILLDRSFPTLTLNNGGPRVRSIAGNRLGFYKDSFPNERLVIDSEGYIHAFGNRNSGEGGTIAGSGNLRVKAAITSGYGNYALSTWHDEDYTSLQIVRYINGAHEQVGSLVATGMTALFTQSSDQTLKQDFRDFDSGAILDALDFGAFEWKADGKTGYGVLAQQAYEVFPQAIQPGSSQGKWAADYSKFVPLLGNQIKKLRARVAELEERVEALTPPPADEETGA